LFVSVFESYLHLFKDVIYLLVKLDIYARVSACTPLSLNGWFCWRTQRSIWCV